MRSRFPTICGRLLMRAAAIGCIVWAVGASGQGTISFGSAGVGAPVYDVDGTTPLAGPDFLAELYAAPPGGSLEPISASITPFLTGAVAGYFYDPNDVTVPGTLVGRSAVVQVVAWRASDGATFAEADHPGGHVGVSKVFTVTGLGNSGPGPPPPPGALLTGLQSFSLQVVVPEPSLLGLWLVSGGGLLLWRRLRRPRDG